MLIKFDVIECVASVKQDLERIENMPFSVFDLNRAADLARELYIANCNFAHPEIKWSSFRLCDTMIVSLEGEKGNSLAIIWVKVMQDL